MIKSWKMCMCAWKRKNQSMGKNLLEEKSKKIVALSCVCELRKRKKKSGKEAVG